MEKKYNFEVKNRLFGYRCNGSVSHKADKFLSQLFPSHPSLRTHNGSQYNEASELVGVYVFDVMGQLMALTLLVRKKEKNVLKSIL